LQKHGSHRQRSPNVTTSAIHRPASITRPDIQPKQKPADVCIGFSYRRVRRRHLRAAPSVEHARLAEALHRRWRAAIRDAEAQPARSFGRSFPIDLDRACFDPRNELPTKLDSVIEGVKSADEERVHPEHVFEDCFGDLLSSSDKT
jgi:hypothetical protein